MDMSSKKSHSMGKVLVVDDDATIRLLASEILSQAGFHVKTVGDGTEVEKNIDEFNPDIVVLDVLMPGMDGFATCAEIRAREHGGNIPVLMMTGLNDLDLIQRLYQLGATDFISKPINWQVLPYRVQYIIRSRQTLSELRRTERELREHDQQMRQYIDRLPVGSILFDRDFGIRQWNPSAERIFGYSEDEALGKSALDLIVPDKSRMQFIELWQQLLHGKRDVLSTNENITKDGCTISCKWTNTPLTDESGVVVSVVSVVEDITEQNRTWELVVQTEKMLTIAGLASGMAHEINNPLAIIAQLLQNVERRLSAELPANQDIARELGIDLNLVATYIERRKIDTFLSEMRGAVKRATSIIDNMLHFSRLNVTSHQLTDLNEVIVRAIELASNDYNLRKKYDFKNITIQRDLDSNLPKLSVNSTEIEQVVINILKNAAQAMAQEKTASPEIRLWTGTEDGFALLRIGDNGPGMPPEVRYRIFDPFFTTKEVGEGTGLGLSVSHSIITKNHAGSISLDSEPSKGSTFSIRLPLV
ncbi:MAG: response regulator [Desulfuromonadaceae bacterium]|nr:response regulator [Desulfuromonadaceae bacterium]MDD5105406.1 response regulator [Desulfuromonadaceae bacterium]